MANYGGPDANAFKLLMAAEQSKTDAITGTIKNLGNIGAGVITKRKEDAVFDQFKGIQVPDSVKSAMGVPGANIDMKGWMKNPAFRTAATSIIETVHTAAKIEEAKTFEIWVKTGGRLNTTGIPTYGDWVNNPEFSGDAAISTAGVFEAGTQNAYAGAGSAGVLQGAPKAPVERVPGATPLPLASVSRDNRVPVDRSYLPSFASHKRMSRAALVKLLFPAYDTEETNPLGPATVPVKEVPKVSEAPRSPAPLSSIPEPAEDRAFLEGIIEASRTE